MLPTPQRPPLDGLQEELRALGLVVVPRAGGFEVRLSLLESVRVSLREGALHCEPRFGAAPRARASWALMMITAVLIPTLLRDTGITPLTLASVFLILAGVGFHGMRYVATEAAITKIQLLWAQLRPRGVPALAGNVNTDQAIGSAATRPGILAEPTSAQQGTSLGEARVPR